VVRKKTKNDVDKTRLDFISLLAAGA